MINFENNSFIDLFVGKNGAGKSNFIEAILIIFISLINRSVCPFQFKVSYQIGEKEIIVEYKDNLFICNGKKQKYITAKSIPDNILVYYSGQNKTISNIIEDFWYKKRGSLTNKTPLIFGLDYDHRDLLIVMALLFKDQDVNRLLSNRLQIEDISKQIKFKFKKPVDAYRMYNWDHTYPKIWNAPQHIQSWFRNLYEIRAEPDKIEDDGYFPNKDELILHFNTVEFYDFIKRQGIFSSFKALYQLKTLSLLESINFELVSTDNENTQINSFSDGQTQSLYYESILSLFGQQNSLVIMDEPDAFLHPEWQFDFSKSLSEYENYSIEKKHILICTHSAATLSNIDNQDISQFYKNEKKVFSNKINKSQAIEALSNSFIKYTEDESKLSINNVIRTSTKPILFVEGPSDMQILNTAYQKLYSSEDIPILIQDAFNRGHIKTLLSRDEIYKDYPDKIFFGLFDFDDAYEDWRKLGWHEETTDIHKGLCKKRPKGNAYALLLPIPDNELLHQVWDESNNIEKISSYHHFTIEHCFWHIDDLKKKYFTTKKHKGRDVITFKGNKVKFAKEVIPNMDKQYFEIFRPMFEFIKEKCEEKCNDG